MFIIIYLKNSSGIIFYPYESINLPFLTYDSIRQNLINSKYFGEQFMKVLVISLPRSRSTNFCCTLSENYSLVNLQEGYTMALKSKNLVNFYLLNHTNIIYKNYTNTILQNEKFIIKLLPRSLIIKKNNQLDNVEIMNNLSENLKPQNFNKIFILNKSNLIDNLCSLLYVTTTNVWHVYQTDDIINRELIFNFDYRLFSSTATIVLEKILLEKIEMYLNTKNINYEKLIDDNISDYLSKLRKPNFISEIPTNRDYKKLIKNYNQIHEYASMMYEEYSKKFEDFHFI